MNMLNIIPPNILKRFTKRAREALERCEEIAHSHPVQDKETIYVDTLHLFYALYKQKGAMAHNIIIAHEVKESEILRAIEELRSTLGLQPKIMRKLYQPIKSCETHILISTSLKRCLKKAVTIASSRHYSLLGTEHLLWGIIDEPTIPINAEKLKELKRHLNDLLESSAHFPDQRHLFGLGGSTIKDTAAKKVLDEEGQKDNHGTKKQMSTRAKTIFQEKLSDHITLFAKNLTEAAQKGTLSPLIGMENEIKKLIRILSRKTKNNPLLLGEPGVGKTAVVEGLAQKIANGEVPRNLASKNIFALDLGLMVAGTVFRGEFEARLKDLLEAISQSGDILFIDEFHNVIGAGAAQGSLDTANMLKPVLSRGEIQCIGATTEEEYRIYIEKDKALERRFQPVFVHEPSEKETLRILTGLKKFYESHYHIDICDGAMLAAVELSNRYVPDRFLPDKAIDLLEEAASELVIKYADIKYIKKFKSIESQYKKLKQEKELAIQNEQYERALELKNEETALAKKMGDAMQKQPPQETARPIKLTREDVTAIVAELTGIPLDKVSVEQTLVFTGLKKRLEKNIIGQDEAIEKVNAALKRARAGLNDPKRPIGSFMFLGPTGVGKTELAKVLALELSMAGGERETLIKLDMAEFTEPHTISRIIGAPPGYVGYEEGSKILAKIRRNPFSVILLDEIEKAHPNIYNVLLSILEDGELTAGDGKRVSFKNSIIIMTSNIGTEEFTKEAILGFKNASTVSGLEERYREIEHATKQELKKTMKPELLSRINEIVVFRPLDKKAIAKIVKLNIRELQKRTRGFTFNVSKETIKFLTKKSFNPETGARLVRKTIEEEIENHLADAMLAGSIKNGAIFIDTKDERITFRNQINGNA